MADFSVLYATAALGVRDLVASVAGVEPDETLLEPFTLAMASAAAALPAGALDATKERLEAVKPLYQSMFTSFDVVLSPVTLSAAVPIGHIDGSVPFEDLVQRIGAYADYTVLHNIVGAPAMSLPLGRNERGLPVGSQFAAGIGDERTLFELAYELEDAKPWGFTLP
jgi:amidase